MQEVYQIQVVVVVVVGVKAEKLKEWLKVESLQTDLLSVILVPVQVVVEVHVPGGVGMVKVIVVLDVVV